MKKTNQVIIAVVGLAVAFAVVTNASAQRKPPQLSDEEIEKIKDASPEAATAKPVEPRKILIFWRCEGFFHGDGSASGNKACEFKGHSTIRVGTGEDKACYRVFRREAMRGGEAPMKPSPDYVHPANLVRWMTLWTSGSECPMKNRHTVDDHRSLGFRADALR